jgi:CheY-like chemotaxis protein/two-component sensor histidine kinase
MGKINILVVEDESFIGLHIRQRLEKLGYHVIMVVASGDEAYQISAERAPDLVIMDIHLEGNLDGVETARTLWERFSTPIVFVTGNIDEKTRLRAEEEWCYGYVSKPFQSNELESAVSHALNKIFLNRFSKENQKDLSESGDHPVMDLIRTRPDQFQWIPNKKEFLNNRDRFYSIELFYSVSISTEDRPIVNMKEFLARITYFAWDKYATGMDFLIDLRFESETIYLPKELAIPLAIIATEAIHNALLFAFPEDSMVPKIEIKFGWNRQKDHLHLLVRDNGIGLNHKKGLSLSGKDMEGNQPTGLGLAMMEGLSSMLGGEFFQSGNPGTCIEIKIPQNHSEISSLFSPG